MKENKVEFTKDTSKGVMKLGFNVWNAERQSIKDHKVDELFHKK